jgi:hypothetical protein
VKTEHGLALLRHARGIQKSTFHETPKGYIAGGCSRIGWDLSRSWRVDNRESLFCGIRRVPFLPTFHVLLYSITIVTFMFQTTVVQIAAVARIWCTGFQRFSSNSGTTRVINENNKLLFIYVMRIESESPRSRSEDEQEYPEDERRLFDDIKFFLFSGFSIQRILCIAMAR